jgi:hypothetical protein
MYQQIVSGTTKYQILHFLYALDYCRGAQGRSCRLAAAVPRERDLQRIETSSLVDFANVLAHTVDGARQSSDLIINTFDAIEATDLSKIREHLSIPVFNL